MWVLNKTTGLQWEVFGAHANDLLKSGHYDEVPVPATIPVTPQVSATLPTTGTQSLPNRESNSNVKNDNGDADSKAKKANRRSGQR